MCVCGGGVETDVWRKEGNMIKYNPPTFVLVNQDASDLLSVHQWYNLPDEDLCSIFIFRLYFYKVKQQQNKERQVQCEDSANGSIN